MNPHTKRPIDINKIKLIISRPHRLKANQIDKLNAIVSTIPDYEKTLHYLSLVASKLWHHWCDHDQDENSETYKALLTLSAVRDAIAPNCADGSFTLYTGLRGNWNADRQCYDEYK